MISFLLIINEKFIDGHFRHEMFVEEARGDLYLVLYVQFVYYLR